MGKVRFHSDVIPVNIEGDSREVCDETIEVNGKRMQYYAATIEIHIA
jgi:hypothetical protein